MVRKKGGIGWWKLWIGRRSVAGKYLGYWSIYKKLVLGDFRPDVAGGVIYRNTSGGKALHKKREVLIPAW